jgi:hypothetical protein
MMLLKKLRGDPEFFRCAPSRLAGGSGRFLIEIKVRGTFL